MGIIDDRASSDEMHGNITLQFRRGGALLDCGRNVCVQSASMPRVTAPSGPDRQNNVAPSDLVALRSPLTGYFRRRVADQNDVADLVQEVFLRLAARAGTEPIDNLQAYAFQVAASVLVDRHRRQAARQHEAMSDLDVDAAGVEIAPDRILEARSSLRAICAALEILPQRTQTVFVLRRIEGLRYQEIAGRLGISVSAVEKHMVRAVEYVARLKLQ